MRSLNKKSEIRIRRFAELILLLVVIMLIYALFLSPLTTGEEVSEISSQITEENSGPPTDDSISDFSGSEDLSSDDSSDSNLEDDSSSNGVDPLADENLGSEDLQEDLNDETLKNQPQEDQQDLNKNTDYLEDSEEGLEDSKEEDLGDDLTNEIPREDNSEKEFQEKLSEEDDPEEELLKESSEDSVDESINKSSPEEPIDYEDENKNTDAEKENSTDYLEEETPLENEEKNLTEEEALPLLPENDTNTTKEIDNPIDDSPGSEIPVVLKRILSLVINKVKAFTGDILALKARLNYENGSPIPEEKVSFYYSNKTEGSENLIGSSLSDSTGFASVNWDTSNLFGNYTIKAVSGDLSGVYNIEIINREEDDNIQVELIDGNGEIIDADIAIFSSGETYDVEISPRNSLVEKIFFKGLVIDSNVSFGFSEVINYTPPEGIEFSKIYAIDFSGLEFDHAEVRSIATENLLYKCKLFDFNSGSCYGSWEMIQKLSKGEQYVIVLSPEDPGFAEAYYSNNSNLDNESLKDSNSTLPVNETNNQTSINQSLVYSERLIQGKVEINKLVQWEKVIKVKNNNDFQVKEEIKLSVPKNALNVKRHDNESKLGVLSLDFYETFDPKEEKSFNLTYETPGPSISEEISGSKKIVTVYSDFHYSNIFTYTSIPESKAEEVSIFWIDDGLRKRIDADYIDTNNNSLIDRLEWITPHLSSQTFEIVFRNLDKLHIYREQPNGVGPGKSFDVVFSVWNEGSEVSDVVIQDTLPSGWKVIAKPDIASVSGETIRLSVGNMSTDSVSTVKYTVKSPSNAKGKIVFQSSVTALGISKEIDTREIEVSDSKGFFDVSVDFLLNNGDIAKKLAKDESYNVKFNIKNIGSSVTDFETYFYWVFDEEKFYVSSDSLSAGCNNGSIEDYGTKKALVCEWPTFLEDEIKSFTVKITPLSEGEELVLVNTTYDPPANKDLMFNLLDLFKILFSKINSFFSNLWLGLKEGGTFGGVVTGVDKKDKKLKETNLMEKEIPLLILKKLPNIVSGEILLRLDLNKEFSKWEYSFEIDNQPDFKNSLRICENTNGSCYWNTSETLDKCLDDGSYCYIRVSATDGVTKSFSKVEKLIVDNTAPQIEELTPSSDSIITQPNIKIKCKAVDNVGSVIYDIKVFYDDYWHDVCSFDSNGICDYNLFGLQDQQEIKFKCIAKDDFGQSSSLVSQHINLAFVKLKVNRSSGGSGSVHENKGGQSHSSNEKQKIWIETLENQFFLIRENTFQEGLVQSDTQVGQPVEWTRTIFKSGNGSEQKFTFEVPIEAYDFRLYKVLNNVPQFFNGSILIENTSGKWLEFSDTPNSLTIYQIKYKTEAPFKLDYTPSEDEKSWEKNVEVGSNVSIHYQNVAASTSIIGAESDQIHLYLIENGSEIDVTQNNNYNFTFEDSNNDGLFDMVRWNVPQLSTKLFKIKVIKAVDFSLQLLDENQNPLSLEAELYEDGVLVNQTEDPIFFLNVSKTYDLKIVLQNNPVSELVFNDLRAFYDLNQSLGIGDSPETSGPPGVVWKEVYSIDPSELNFSNVTVKVTSKGEEVYKCKDWNFTEQSCFGTWVRIETLSPGENYTFTLSSEDPGFAEGKINFTVKPNINSKKNDFLSEESAFFDFEYISDSELEAYKVSLENSSKPIKTKVWISDYEIIQTSVYDSSGKETTIEAQIEEIRQGKFNIRLPNPRDLKPGSYTLRVNLTKDNISYVQEQNFTWGVLVVNPDKSIYLPGQTSFLGMAVLNDEGKMVCDADVTLQIINPLGVVTILKTSDNTINVSPECEVYGVTNMPDYYAYYFVNSIGNYTLNLTAITDNGIRSIIDHFEVKNQVRFDVTRNAPTRIYPPVPYTVSFTVVPYENFTGEVKEYVPVDFEITPQTGMTITQEDDFKVLTWNKNFVTGKSYGFSYNFDAPDISPYLFTLGPLKIDSWEESRIWKIASDAPVTEILMPFDSQVSGGTLDVENAYDSDTSTYSLTDIFWSISPAQAVAFHPFNENSSPLINLYMNVSIRVPDGIDANDDEWRMTYSWDGSNWYSWYDPSVDGGWSSGRLNSITNISYDLTTNLSTQPNISNLRVALETDGIFSNDTLMIEIYHVWLEGIYQEIVQNPNITERLRPTAHIDSAATVNPTYAYDTLSTSFSSTPTDFSTLAAEAIQFNTWEENTSNYYELSLNVTFETLNHVNDLWQLEYSTDGGTNWTIWPGYSFNSNNLPETTVGLMLDPDQRLDLLKVRIQTDKVANGDGGSFRFYDIWVDGSYVPPVGEPPLITINTPNGENIYNFLDSTNNKAYSGADTSQPPTTLQTTGTEPTDYSVLEEDDASRWETSTTTNTEMAHHSFKFLITDSTTLMNSIDVLWNGNCRILLDRSGADICNLYIWNETISGYSLLASTTLTTEDSDLSYSITSDFNDYIDSNGYVWLLVQADSKVTGATDLSEVRTDYVQVKVSSTPVISGSYLINATVSSSDAVESCEYNYANETYSFYWIGMDNNTAIEDWTNISDTVNDPPLADTYYNLTVSCTSIRDVSQVENVSVFVSNAAPSIKLISPDNESIHTNNTITFQWNATHNAGGFINCNLTLDNKINTSSAISKQSGSLWEHLGENLPDGNHQWNITCWKTGGNSATSDLWNFSLDTTPPEIALLRPLNDNWTNRNNITFFYLPYDTLLGVDNCSLVLDGIRNVSNSSEIVEGVENNITSFLLGEGLHNWTMSCVDIVNNNQTNSSVWNFTIDWTPPWIDLNAPLNSSVIATTYYSFNWTSYDNLDDNITCNLTVNGIVQGKEIDSTNGTPQTYLVDTLVPGLNEWNITCWDNASNYNTSESYYVNVDVAPVISLIAPENDNWSNFSNYSFFFETYDDFGYTGCTLILDNFLNETNATEIINGSVNNITVSLIGEGHHNWTVNCTDSGGNIGYNDTIWNFTVDFTPPEVNLSGPDNNSLINSLQADFNWTVMDNLDKNLTCNLTLNNLVEANNIESDNGALENVVVSGLTGGDWEWNVTCWDNASNINTSISWFFSVGMDPYVNLVYPANGNFTNVENITLFYEPVDDLGFSNCTIMLDGQTNESNSSEILNLETNNITISLLGEGLHNWTVNCTDISGTEGTNLTEWNFTVDLTEPTINLTGPANNTQVDVGEMDFNWTAMDNIDEVLSCDLKINNLIRASDLSSDNGSITNIHIVGLDASNEWNVTCRDNASNVNTSISFFLQADQQPNVSLFSPLNDNWTNSPNTTFFYVPEDNVGLKNCTIFLDDTANESNSSEILNNEENNITIDLISEGHHNWTIECIDLANNVRLNETIWNFTVDFTLPWIDLNLPENDSNITSNSYYFNWTAYDNFDINLTCDFTLNSIVVGQDVESTNGTPQIYYAENLYSGYNEWNVTCKDNASNTNTSASFLVYVDKPPGVELISPLNNNWSNVSNTTFFYFPYDDFGFANCSIILDGFINESNPIEVINGTSNSIEVDFIGEGHHNWTAMCVDSIGSSTVNDSVWNFTIDWTPMAIDLEFPTNYYNSSTSTLNFNWTATDNLDENLTCNFTLDGIINQSEIESDNGTISEITIENLGIGQHEWNVTCWDNASNYNTSLSWYFNVNLVPVISLEYPPDEHWNTSENLSFTYYVSDNDGINNCTFVLDGLLNESNSSAVQNNANNSFIVENLAEGEHNWTVTCWDPDDGQGTGSPVRIFYVDQSYPIINNTSPENNSNIYGSDVTFNWIAEDNLDSLLECDLILDNNQNNTNTIYAPNGSEVEFFVENIAAGWHEWNATCWDNVSFENTSYSFYFFINDSPQIQINFPENDYWVGVDHVNISYTPIDNDGLSFCIFYLDNFSEFNITDATIENDEPNYFNPINSGEGTHNWTISCNDTSVPANEIFAFTRNFTVDLTEPQVILNLPTNGSFISENPIRFNWTTTDNLDPKMLCNLTINNSLVGIDLISLNGTPTILDITNISDGFQEWNVTCWDNANNTNVSVTGFINVSIDMSLDLIDPLNNNWTSSENLTFLYNVTDNDEIVGCTLILDDTANQSNLSEIIQGSLNNFTVDLLDEGLHNWTVNCTTDQGLSIVNETIWNFTIDWTNATIDLNSPINNYNTSLENVTFNWTVFDNLDDSLTCSLTIDDKVNASGIESLSGSSVTQRVDHILEGNHLWNVTCEDNASNINYSVTWKFTVDYTAPEVALGDPSNSTWWNETNMTFYYTPSETYTTIENCTLILNNLKNVTNFTILNNKENNFSLENMGDDYYWWTVNCTDLVNNIGTNTTGKAFWIDTTPPSIRLNDPEEGETFNVDDITFNFTAIDNLAINLTCNLTLDDVINISNINVTNGTDELWIIENISEGDHNWSVTCWDVVNNTNYSVLGNFTINQPDLTLNVSDIVFNNTNPDVGENITINATIYNIGGRKATNITIQFLDNLIEVGKSTIDLLEPAGDNQTVNITWNISEGYHKVWVRIDPDLEIPELNESNNNASRVLTTLTANISSPFNETWTYNTSVDFNFTLSDYLNNTINFTLYLDGLINTQGNWTDRNETNITLSLIEGTHYIIVEATELDPLSEIGDSRSKNSTEVWIYIDFTGPEVSFNTLNDSWFNETTPEINFTITDNMDPYINFTFYLNGTLDELSKFKNETVSNISVASYYNLSEQGEGVYELIIEAIEETGNSTNSSSITIFIDYTKPMINLSVPLDNFNTSTDSVGFNWTVWDNLDPILDCNLTIDNETNLSNINVFNLMSTFQTVENIGDGAHLWNVTCWDNASNINTSETRKFTIDTTPPVINLGNPSNETYFGTTNVTFFFTPSEGLTDIVNCSIILDDEINKTKTLILNNKENNISVDLIGEGEHNWTVNCTDLVNNVGTSSLKKVFYVDTIGPNITLNYPLSGTNLTDSKVNFNWTVTDNFDLNITCNLTIDDSFAAINIESPNDTLINQSILGLSDGFHLWNVSCWDDANNTNVSETRNFTVYTIESPLNLIATLNGWDNQSVDLNWTNVSKAEYFNIYISLNYSSGFPDVPNYTKITNLNFTDPDAGNDMQRYYKVSAVYGPVENLSSQVVGKFDMNIDTGFNLIGIPLNLTYNELGNESVVGNPLPVDPPGAISYVYRYNTSEDFYESTEYSLSTRTWTPTVGSNNFTQLDMIHGYWFECTLPAKVILVGEVITSNITIQLNNSYNMVSWPSLDPRLLGNESEINPLVVNPEESVTVIDRYNNITDSYETTVHYSEYGWIPSAQNPEFTEFEPGRGYFFDVVRKANWTHDPFIWD